MSSDSAHTKKKKKPARLVASRYMQAAANVTVCSSKGNSTVSSKKSSGKADTELNYTQASGFSEFNLISTAAANTVIPACDASVINQANASQMPVCLALDNFISTPMTKNAAPFECDASVISMVNCSLMPTLKQPLVVPSIAGGRPKANSKPVFSSDRRGASRVPVPAIHTQYRKDKNKAYQAEVDVAYCKYLQMKYLYTKTMFSIDKRAQHSVEELHKLFTKNQILVDSIQKSKLDLFHLRYIKFIQEFNEQMVCIFEPRLKPISDVVKKLRQIANAVENIRHQLPTLKIQLTIDNDEEGTACLLEQCNSLLLEINSLILERCIGLPKLAEVLTKGALISENLTKDLFSYLQLASAADTLTISETTLKL